MQGGNFFAIPMKIQILYIKNPEAIIRGLSTVNALSISPTCTQHCLKKLLFLKKQQREKRFVIKSVEEKLVRSYRFGHRQVLLQVKGGRIPSFRYQYRSSHCIGRSFSWILIPKQLLHSFKMKLYKRYNHFITLKHTFYVKVLL